MPKQPIHTRILIRIDGEPHEGAATIVARSRTEGAWHYQVVTDDPDFGLDHRTEDGDLWINDFEIVGGGR
jgi:hypothetical protein